jgi:predicted esterase
VIEEAGVSRDAVLSMAVFTTQDPVEEVARIRDWIMSDFEVPEVRDTSWRLLATNPTFVDFEGTFGPLPTFQQGEAPYTTAGTGGIEFEADGTPKVASTFEGRFALTLPRGPMPEAGYPIVLYAHGTGGDYRSFTRESIDEELASVGYAVMGFDQVLHGPRNPTSTSPDSLFFNVINPLAARDNNRQSALDVVQQARFAASLVLPTRIATREDRPVRFDPSRIYVYGHSQGGLNLPLFLAVDDQTRGGVLSAAGGTLAISIIEKDDPIDIGAAVWLLLTLPGATPEMGLAMEDFTYEHPVLTLLQTWLEPGDTVNYGRMIAREPRAGFAPKSILQTQGRLDTFTSAASGHSLAAAIGTAIVEPVSTPLDAMALQGIEPAAPPLRGNVGDGSATTGLYQFPGGDHFVVFESTAAQRAIRHFFETATTGAPELEAL